MGFFSRHPKFRLSTASELLLEANGINCLFLIKSLEKLDFNDNKYYPSYQDSEWNLLCESEKFSHPGWNTIKIQGV